MRCTMWQFARQFVVGGTAFGGFEALVSPEYAWPHHALAGLFFGSVVAVVMSVFEPRIASAKRRFARRNAKTPQGARTGAPTVPAASSAMAAGGLASPGA